MNNDTINKKKKCARCLSTGHAHAVVSATVRVVGKKLVSCKIDVGDVVGHCGAVGHRIAPAINDMLSPAARSEKSNTPHQSAPMDRKSESRVDVSERHCLHGPLARNEINKSFEVAGEVAKGPGNQDKVGAVRPKLLREG